MAEGFLRHADFSMRPAARSVRGISSVIPGWSKPPIPADTFLYAGREFHGYDLNSAPGR
jgi:hypothetical protein